MRTRFQLLITFALTGCLFGATGCRSMYYAAYEKMGVHKRDLMKSRVTEARDGQQEAQEQFKDALTRLKEITRFDGGRLEEAYNSLKGEYEDCEESAERVRDRIRAVETVAGDLFEEWEREITEIGTPSLRESSRQRLSATRKRYEEMHRAMVRAEQTMPPVLSQLHDYVLFLKHNLNAQAVASLKGETADIEKEIGRLIEQMNRSIAQVDEFIKTLK